MMNEHENWPHRHFLLWGLAALVGVIAIFATISLLFYYYPPAVPVGMMYYYPFGFGARILFGLFLLFAFFFVLRMVFWGGWGWRYRRAYWGGYGYGRHRDSAYYILRERYAKGEITKDQYDQMMRDLDQHTNMP